MDREGSGGASSEVTMLSSAVLIFGMATFIAAYHYIRIFKSCVGVPLNDVCRYMEWLPTVPSLLIEISVWERACFLAVPGCLL